MLFKEEPETIRITVRLDGRDEVRYVVGEKSDEVLAKIESLFGVATRQEPKPKKIRRKRRTKKEIEAEANAVTNRESDNPGVVNEPEEEQSSESEEVKEAVWTK